MRGNAIHIDAMQNVNAKDRRSLQGMSLRRIFKFPRRKTIQDVIIIRKKKKKKNTHY